MIAMSFKFNCEDCGEEWEFKIKTQGPHRCESCAGMARKEGRGPVQMARTRLVGDVTLPVTQERSHSATHESRPSSLPKDVKAIWDLASKHANQDQRITEDITRSRTLDVKLVTRQDVLRECAWAIFGAGFRYTTLKNKWCALKVAFLEFDAQKIVARSKTVEQQALKVIANHRKVEAVITIAGRLNSQDWLSVRSTLLSLITWDTQNNPCVSRALLDYFDHYPQVGRILASYIAKNIGVASIKPDIWIVHLAKWLGHAPNEGGVWDMARAFQVETGENIQTIDTILWNWAKEQQELTQ